MERAAYNKPRHQPTGAPMATVSTENRLSQRIEWYDHRAVQSKRWHLTVQHLSMLLSIMLVWLIHVDCVSRFFLSTLAALLAIAVGVERISGWGEKWRLYRLTAEALESEHHLYSVGAGPYSSDAQTRDRLLAERMEQILKGEAHKWEALT